MNENLKQLQTRLGEAINEALTSDAIAEAVQELQAHGYECGKITLEVIVENLPVHYLVPVAPTVQWLERMYKFEDKR
jgi:hypothetical protein